MRLFIFISLKLFYLILFLRNILVKNYDLKISDFGISKILTATLTSCQSGTLVYQAPEIFEGKGCGLKSDIW